MLVSALDDLPLKLHPVPLVLGDSAPAGLLCSCSSMHCTALHIECSLWQRKLQIQWESMELAVGL